MIESTKIEFQHRRVARIEDVTDLAPVLFPGNANQQHAAAQILLHLRQSAHPQPTLRDLEQRHGISRRTLQRARAKLARLGLIEYATWISARKGGQEGWKLSGRMSTALRQLADRIDAWRYQRTAEQCRKEQVLAGMLK